MEHRNYMLVDDSKIDLFVARKVIERVDKRSRIKSFSSAMAAIKYLKLLESSPLAQSMLVPNIIFLDINMPEFNGFQFINEFNKLKFDNKQNIRIYILSSSTYLVDIEKSKRMQSCKGYIDKPLTQLNVEKILFEKNYGT